MQLQKALWAVLALAYCLVVVLQFRAIQREEDAPLSLTAHDPAVFADHDQQLNLAMMQRQRQRQQQQQQQQQRGLADEGFANSEIRERKAFPPQQQQQQQQQQQHQQQQHQQQLLQPQRHPQHQIDSAPAVAPAEAATAAATKLRSLNKRSECQLANMAPSNYSESTDALLSEIPFANPHGGAWTQGWPVTYDESEWSDSPLHVHLVPHSHNDPGWLKTVDEYFEQQTIHIISNVIEALDGNPERTFIWAETSYLSMWYERASANDRGRLQRLVKSGQLEIVNGGWVMPDEANSHYYALIDQLIEGHQYLWDKLGVKPSRGWSIDPFGQSPTMAYILHRAGFNSMLIQRVHYEFKHALAQKKKLEFSWMQEWDRNQNTGIFCHLMPFFSYDVPHTCGPEPKVCCQFDFARTIRFGCPWGVNPELITEDNVAQRAAMLVDQYRKKAQLYRTKHVLIPLGDDFRYMDMQETNLQYDNYEKLFNYINKTPALKTVAKFSTLTGYFQGVMNSPEFKDKQKVPTFAGDFFTYADRGNNYWSGYYSSRPYYKYLDRVLEYSLRRVEILFSAAIASPTLRSPLQKEYATLVECRRALALFQHHDGITGTAKDPVVVDYGSRLVAAINKADDLSAEILQWLFAGGHASPATFSLTPFSKRPGHDRLPLVKAALVSTHIWVTVFNSLAQAREEMVHYRVSSADVIVKDANGNEVPCQINPVWESATSTYADMFDVWFEAKMSALGASRYLIEGSSSSSTGQSKKAEIRSASGNMHTGAFKFSQLQSGQDIVFANAALELLIDGKTGRMKRLTVKDASGPVVQELNARFLCYGTTNSGEKSGAYLFMPDGPAKTYPPSEASDLRVIEGPLMSELRVAFGPMEHQIRVFKSEGFYAQAVWVRNLVNVQAMNNQEFVMRFETNVASSNTYYSDLNGFQMRKRQYMAKLTMQGNFYPMPTTGFVEDTKSRFTLHTRSAMGSSSLSQGWLEVVLDRRLMQDDARGLEQGVTDNRITEFNFALHVERKISASTNVTLVAPTSFAHRINDMLNHPPFKAVASGDLASASAQVKLLQNDLPCDVHIVNLRTLSPKLASSALVVHRKSHACDFAAPSIECSRNGGIINIQKLISTGKVATVQEKTLSLMHDVTDKSDYTSYPLSPSELHAFELTWAS